MITSAQDSASTNASANPQEKPQDKPKNPNEPLANIEITPEEVRQHLVRYQQNFQKSITREGLSATEKQASSECKGAEDVIGSSTYLNREHVHGVAVYCVGERAHLREKVGVFPTIHLTEIVMQAREVAYHKIVAHEAYKDKLPSKAPLLEKSQCKSSEELEARNKEEKHRNALEKELNERESIRVLAHNKYTLPRLVQTFLEAMSEGKGLLGNPYKRDLTFDECSQFIIPMRTGENYQNWSDTHYDVMVVKLNRESKKAEMTFYDSLCWKLGPLYQRALENFFKAKGFEVSLNDVSSRDQMDGYNCGMFAALKGVEIASQNEGVEEKLIASFKEGDYQKTANNFRCLFGYSLQAMGYNIAVEKSLENSVSVSNKGAATLREFARLLDELSNQIQKMSDVLPAHPVLSLKSLGDLTANDIFERCEILRKEIENLLKQKLANDKKEPADVENIKFLFNMLLAINLTNEEYKAKIKEISAKEENKTASWFSKLSWPKRILYGAVALGSSILGGGYLIASFLKFTALLPANPFVLVMLSTLGYVALHEKLKGKKSKLPTTAEIDDAAAQETLLSLLEVSSSVMPQSQPKSINVEEPFVPEKGAVTESVPSAPVVPESVPSIPVVPESVPVAPESIPVALESQAAPQQQILLPEGVSLAAAVTPAVDSAIITQTTNEVPLAASQPSQSAEERVPSEVPVEIPPSTVVTPMPASLAVEAVSSASANDGEASLSNSGEVPNHAQTAVLSEQEEMPVSDPTFTPQRSLRARRKPEDSSNSSQPRTKRKKRP